MKFALTGLFATLVACGGESMRYDAAGNPTGNLEPAEDPIVSEPPSANAGRGGSSATGGKGGTGNVGEAPTAGKGGSTNETGGTAGTNAAGSGGVGGAEADPCRVKERRLYDLDDDGYGDPDHYIFVSVCDPWEEGFVNWIEGRDDCDDNDPSVQACPEEPEAGSVTVSLEVGDLPGRNICVTDDDESTLQFDLTTEGDVPPVTGVTLRRVGSGTAAGVKTLSVEIGDAFISDKIEVLGDSVYVPFNYAIQLPADSVTTFVVHAAFDETEGEQHAFEITNPEDLEFEGDAEVKGLFPVRGNTFTLLALPGLCETDCDPKLTINVTNALESDQVPLGAEVAPLQVRFAANECGDIEIRSIGFSLIHVPSWSANLEHFCAAPCDAVDQWGFQNGVLVRKDLDWTIGGPLSMPNYVDEQQVTFYLRDMFIIRAGTELVTEPRISISNTEVVPMVGKRYDFHLSILDFKLGLDYEYTQLEAAEFTVVAP